MEQAIAEAFKWGGWPAVILVAVIAFAKWYCGRKLEQDKVFHDERMKQHAASDRMMEALVNAVIALVYKSMSNEEAAKVMADISKQHLETVRASTRTEGQ